MNNHFCNITSDWKSTSLLAFQKLYKEFDVFWQWNSITKKWIFPTYLLDTESPHIPQAGISELCSLLPKYRSPLRPSGKWMYAHWLMHSAVRSPYVHNLLGHLWSMGSTSYSPLPHRCYQSVEQKAGAELKKVFPKTYFAMLASILQKDFWSKST